MSKSFYSPTVGIDTSADFSYVSTPAPNGDIYKKSFKIKHDVNSFNYLLKLLKNGEEFNMKTDIFMESTGVCHLCLFHFLIRAYYKLTDTCSTFKKKLSADLSLIFPGYNTIFSNIASLTSLEILSNYPSDKAVLHAPEYDILAILIKVYSKLFNTAT